MPGWPRASGSIREELASPEGVEVLAGNRVPEGATPIALAYAGHQFGHFVPQLGDGRAILLGEVVGRDGARRDIQLKGSGRTPFSRDGDGRAALGPVLREYIVSEAMAALGVPTTRALAAVTTGEPVLRETAAARRRPDARGREPHPRRHLPVFRRAGRCGGGAAAGGLCDRPPLPGGRDGGAPLPRAAGRGGGAPGRSRRPLAAHRLHPWRDEHRQHLHCRRDDRLRPLRLHGRLRSGHGVQLDRPSRPLRLWQPAAHRAVEPRAARRDAAAAAGRGRGSGGGGGARSRCGSFARASRRPISAACGARSASPRSARAMPRWPRTC